MHTVILFAALFWLSRSVSPSAVPNMSLVRVLVPLAPRSDTPTEIRFREFSSVRKRLDCFSGS